MKRRKKRRYYDFLNPSVNFMDPNCVEVLGERCQILGMKKTLIVTDDFLASMKNGPVEQSIAFLRKLELNMSSLQE